MAILKTIQCDCQLNKQPDQRTTTLEVIRSDTVVAINCSACKKTWDEPQFIAQYRQWHKEKVASRRRDYMWLEQARGAANPEYLRPNLAVEEEDDEEDIEEEISSI